jgi:hypothetical protein
MNSAAEENPMFRKLYPVTALAALAALGIALLGGEASGAKPRAKSPASAAKGKKPVRKGRCVLRLKQVKKPLKGRTYRALQAPAKVFVLNDDWKVGDCHMRPGATITFKPDGSGTVRAEVYTEQSFFGDIWHQSFSVKNASSELLFHLGEYTQQNGKMKPPTIHRLEANFRFDRSKYDEIAEVEFLASC